MCYASLYACCDAQNDDDDVDEESVASSDSDTVRPPRRPLSAHFDAASASSFRKQASTISAVSATQGLSQGLSVRRETG